MRRVSKSLAFLACLLIAGCEGKATTTEAGWTEISWGGGGAGLKEITLPSGRQCVAMIGYYKAALTCDWGSK